MKKLLLILLFLTPFVAHSQVLYNTGNAQFDADLKSISASAEVNFGAFKSEMSIGYNVSERKIEQMRGTLKMAPGEIYLALEISKMTKKPVDDILNIYTTNKSKGWGYIAKSAGIKPGSPEFHQLKNNASNKKAKGQGNSKSKGQGKGKNK